MTQGLSYAPQTARSIGTLIFLSRIVRMNRQLRLWGVFFLVTPGYLFCLLQSVPGVPFQWAELVRFAPYYWVLPPALLACALLWRLPWWTSLLTVLNLALILTVGMGLRWNPEHPASGTGASVRVMTFNTKAYKARYQPGGLAALAEEIRAQNADLVTLQDADGLLKGVSETVPRRMPSFLAYPEVYAMGQYIIASRFPIQACAGAELGPDERSRNFMHCIVNVQGVPVTVVTAHLLSPRYSFLAVRSDPRHGMADWTASLNERLAQSEMLHQALRPMPRPLLVMGDFNAREESPVLDPLNAMGLVDAYSSAGQGWGFTYGHTVHLRRDFLRIDHILASPEIDITGAWVGKSRISDHHAVIADLRLAPANKTARP